MSPIRHEYVAGELFALCMAPMRHKVIADNLLVLFATHLRGGQCRAFSSDVKVRLQINQHDIFYYPDVTVACGPQDMDAYYLMNPCLVVEVLSPSSHATDWREKRIFYQQIATLEEYVVIAQRPPQVVLYRRSNRWMPVVLTELDAIAQFRSIDLNLTLEKIYDGVQ
jgi:Uma2 family endonuclease